MNQQSNVNKKAWEHRAYEFWNMRDGRPEEKAGKIMIDPLACLKKHKKYFGDVNGKTIANICGSNGRKAVPLALLGADVTVFDISEENKRYALELAKCAGVTIDYILGDFYEVDDVKYKDYFDYIYMEGGILHYFDDINRLCNLLYKILKTDGQLILSDFHPFRKFALAKSNESINYFDTEMHTGDVAYKGFFTEEEQSDFPDVLLRFYTMSEIMNAVLDAGFIIKKFEEHPHWVNANIPGEFTIYARK
jgi:SAM-dependent methyltransferase